VEVEVEVEVGVEVETEVKAETEAETEAGIEVWAAEQRQQNGGGSLPRLERAMVVVVAREWIYCWRMWLSRGAAHEARARQPRKHRLGVRESKRGRWMVGKGRGCRRGRGRGRGRGCADGTDGTSDSGRRVRVSG
jgi:hypothetical protein